MYKIIRIKLKISYYAWLKDISVKSLLFQQIEQSYFQLEKHPKMKRICVHKILSDISYADVLEIITNNIDIQKAESKFKRFSTMRITGNVATNLQNAIKFADVTKKTRSTAQILSQKIRRITSLLPLLSEYNRNNVISIPIIQLLNEREELSRQ